MENLDQKITVALGPLDSNDVQNIRMWSNDYSIWKWLRRNDFISDIAQHHWYEKQAKDPTIKMYKIVVVGKDDGDKQKLVPVGVCGFSSIDAFNRRAEFGLFIAPAFQKRGLGKLALRLLLDHGFKNMGFNLIWAEIFDKNPAITMLEDFGFHKDGIRRDFYWREGKFIDAHIFSIKECECYGQI